jgi:hypothetical protein
VSDVFVSLYLDEDVDVLVGTLVAARAFKVATTVGSGNLGKTDEEQLAFAASAGLTMLMHNRADFERLAAGWLATGKVHGGIIIAVRRPAYDLARRLLVLLNDVPADEMRDQVRYI